MTTSELDSEMNEQQNQNEIEKQQEQDVIDQFLADQRQSTENSLIIENAMLNQEDEFAPLMNYVLAGSNDENNQNLNN